MLQSVNFAIQPNFVTWLIITRRVDRWRTAELCLHQPLVEPDVRFSLIRLYRSFPEMSLLIPMMIPGVQTVLIPECVHRIIPISSETRLFLSLPQKQLKSQA